MSKKVIDGTVKLSLLNEYNSLAIKVSLNKFADAKGVSRSAFKQWFQVWKRNGSEGKLFVGNLSGCQPEYVEVEDELLQFIKAKELASGKNYQWSWNELQMQARAIAKRIYPKKRAYGFRASIGWLSRTLKRHDVHRVLLSHAKTSHVECIDNICGRYESETTSACVILEAMKSCAADDLTDLFCYGSRSHYGVEWMHKLSEATCSEGDASLTLAAESSKGDIEGERTVWMLVGDDIVVSDLFSACSCMSV